MKTLALTASLAAAIPPSMVSAQAPKSADRRAATRIRDVALDSNGALVGYLADAKGQPFAQESVAILQGRRRVAVSRTDAKGRFEVAGLKGGLYQIYSAKGTAAYRVWACGTAPKSAMKCAVVGNDERQIRGQDEMLSLFGVEGGSVVLGTVIIGGVTYLIVEAVNLSNDNDDLQRQIQFLQQNQLVIITAS